VESSDRFGLYGLSDAPLLARIESMQQTKSAPKKEKISEIVSRQYMPYGAVGCPDGMLALVCSRSTKRDATSPLGFISVSRERTAR